MKALIVVALLVGFAWLAGGAGAAAPQNAPAITSPTHAKGVPANESIAHFDWTAVGGSAQYRHALTQNATTEPTTIDNETDGTSADVLVPASGQWYFHVVAVSDEGRSPAGHYGPVSRNLTVAQRCAAAFGNDGKGPDEAALEECLAAAQNKVAPEAILAMFLAFLAKFGSASLRRG
ncbi:MAG: hypothetical protein HYT80_00695 [Euryarchaeota archaeon]|nr:hypothetical protein [Euryarchaeota archaeon]